jgi:hypothetical protein
MNYAILKLIKINAAMENAVSALVSVQSFGNVSAQTEIAGIVLRLLGKRRGIAP